MTRFKTALVALIKEICSRVMLRFGFVIDTITGKTSATKYSTAITGEASPLNSATFDLGARVVVITTDMGTNYISGPAPLFEADVVGVKLRVKPTIIIPHTLIIWLNCNAFPLGDALPRIVDFASTVSPVIGVNADLLGGGVAFVASLSPQGRFYRSTYTFNAHNVVHFSDIDPLAANNAISSYFTSTDNMTYVRREGFAEQFSDADISAAKRVLIISEARDSENANALFKRVKDLYFGHNAVVSSKKLAKRLASISISDYDDSATDTAYYNSVFPGNYVVGLASGASSHLTGWIFGVPYGLLAGMNNMGWGSSAYGPTLWVYLPVVSYLYHNIFSFGPFDVSMRNQAAAWKQP